jgi:hypothetical protein
MTRGCGELAHDAMYHYWPLGKGGIPIKSLTLCPVWVLDRVALGISYQGMTILPQLDLLGDPVIVNGKPVMDIYDVVGRKYYKYKTDFYQEGCLQGFSRRWPTSLDVSLLTPGYSVHYICTDAAAYKNESANEMREEVNCCQAPSPPFLHECYKGIHQLPFDERWIETCTAQWYHEITKDDAVDRMGTWFRKIKSTDPKSGLPWSYTVHPRDKEPEWLFGAFMALPIGIFRATTPRGSDVLSNRVQKAVQKAADMGIPVMVTKLNPDLPDSEEEDDE